MKISILKTVIISSIVVLSVNAGLAAGLTDGGLMAATDQLKQTTMKLLFVIIPIIFILKFIAALHKIVSRSNLTISEFIFGGADGKRFLFGEEKAKKSVTESKAIDGRHIAEFYKTFGGNDFLKDYPAILQERKAVNELTTRIKQSKMTTSQKERAAELESLSDKTIETLRELHQLGKVSGENKSMAAIKLGEVKAGLTMLVNNHSNMVASGFSDIKIPDTFQKQEQLELLRIEGKRLLARIENDPNFDSVEDKFRLAVIVEKRLDEVWTDYVTAKTSFFDDNEEGIFTINKSKGTTPDTIIDMIFDDISNIYQDISVGAKNTKKTNDLGDLLTSKRYFERR